jgi:hypothetical protein
MPNALLIMTKKNRECIFHITAEVHTEIWNKHTIKACNYALLQQCNIKSRHENK